MWHIDNLAAEFHCLRRDKATRQILVSLLRNANLTLTGSSDGAFTAFIVASYT
ncbi:MAG: hypothetical protein ACTXOO_03370 [Sodalis sp. (in: enterobacteria)]